MTRDGPEAGPLGLVVPVDGRLAAEDLEHLVGHGVDVVVAIDEVDVLQLHAPDSTRSF